MVYWAPLQRAFDTTGLALVDWLLAAAVASTVIGAGEAVKAVHRRP